MLESYILQYVSQRQKKDFQTRAPKKDSSQPVHPHTLIRVFAVRIKTPCILDYQTAPNEDSDQTAQMRSLIWIFVGRTWPKARLLTFMLLYSHTCQISHCEIKSHRICPIFKAIPIKIKILQNSQTIFQQILWRKKHKTRAVVVFLQVSYTKEKDIRLYWGAPKWCFRKSHRILSNLR